MAQNQMKVIKLTLAVIAITLAFDNVDREQLRIAGYWALVAVYWTMNALGG